MAESTNVEVVQGVNCWLGATLGSEVPNADFFLDASSKPGDDIGTDSLRTVRGY